MRALGNVVGIGRLSGGHLCNVVSLPLSHSLPSGPGFDDPPELSVVIHSCIAHE